MKHTLLLTALLACITTSAHATGYTPPKNPDPVPIQPPSQPINVDMDAAAKASAAAQAAAKAAAQSSSNSAALGIAGGGSSDASATGGTSDATAVGNGGAADSYAANGSLINQHSSRTFVFPAPVWTQVPQAFGCFVTESRAGSVGWNFASGSKTVQFSDVVCVSIRMAEAARQMCHFETADHIDRNTYKTMFPSATAWPETQGLKNLSLAECEEIKRPRLVMSPTIASPAQASPVTIIQSQESPAVCTAPAAAPAPKSAQRRVVKVKPKADDCERSQGATS